MRIRRVVTGVLAASALLLAAAAPAGAELRPPPPLPDDPTTSYFYNLWFGPTTEGWSPEGTVTADSGFRPFPNGFPYANYGGGMPLISQFFGTPNVPMVGLNSIDMRSLYGDGVCTSTKGLKPGGPCALTPVAEYWAEHILDSAQGGVCFGMAATAGAIYNGESSPSVVGASTLTSQSRLTQATQRAILRNYGAQFTSSSAPLLRITPAEVIEALQAGLVDNVAPYILLLYGTDPNGHEGGHAINPYAVYDRGNGLYDIAVYDNNYPTRERAVHVDTVANTWEYFVMTNPGGPPSVWTGDAETKTLGLVSTADILAQQSCPFCLGRSVDLVTFSSLPNSAGRIGLDLLSLDESRLPRDRYEVLPTLNPPGPNMTSQPSAEVIREDGFMVTVVGSGLTEIVPLTVSNVSARGGKILGIDKWAPGGGLEVQYEPEVFTVLSTTPVVMDLTRAFSVQQRHFSVQARAGQATGVGNGRQIALNRAAGQVILGDANAQGGRMVVDAELRVGNKTSAYQSKSVKYPAGGKLVLVYGSWKTANQAPQLWLDRDGDGTLDKRIPMQRAVG
jgi:hypothetical protein